MHGHNKGNEQIYLRALKGADIVLWEWNIENNTLFFSNNFNRIIENIAGDFEDPFDFIQKTAVNADMVSAKNDLIFFLNGNASLYKSEFRISTNTAKVKYIFIRGKAFRNQQGNISSISGAIKDVTEKKAMEKHINHLAYYDSLTDLPNRLLFVNDLKTALNNSSKGALMFIDIDNFKLVNDTLGHDYGDLLLIIFSQLIVACIKGFGKMYRISGDEFMILVKKFNSPDELLKLCEKIFCYLKNPFEVKNNEIHVTISMGITLFPKDSRDIGELYKYADLALYRAKVKGKNTFTFFQRSIFNSYRRKNDIKEELKTAIKNREFYIQYQPQVNTAKNQITGFEALLRWQNSRLGFVPASEFIPIAEMTGNIVEIGEWVLESVCKTICEMGSKNYILKKISVNVSPIQLKKDDFADKFITTYEKYNIPPSLLEIEITEGTLIDLFNYKIETINKLLKTGVKISIDDFGKGYSSLNYLTTLPINTIKIDKSFIDNIYDKKNKSIIKCMIDLSKSLNYEIIAEGVETKKQLNLLSEIGCNIIQGYYFSRPLSPDKAEKFLIEKI